MTHNSGLVIERVSFNKEKQDPGAVTCSHLQWVLRKRARSRPETGSQDMNPRPEGLLPGYESSQPLKGPAAGLGDSRKLEELEGSGHLLSHKPPHAQVPAQE